MNQPKKPVQEVKKEEPEVKKEEKKDAKKDAKKDEKKDAKKEDKKTEEAKDDDSKPKEPPPKDRMDVLDPDEQVIGFGPATTADLAKATAKPLRLLWDGELDLCERPDTKFLTRVLLDSLLKRRAEVPPHKRKRKLTLINGTEARDAIVAINEIVQLEEKERQRQARKARLAAAGEDDEEVEPEEEPIEEEDKKKFDNATVCTDCLTEVPFSTRVMQGTPIPGLLRIAERPRPTRDELECDLSVLEDI